MTTLTRKQRLAAVARAHDAWVEANLSEADEVFDPAAHPKPGSDYNQHVLDIDASGETEDEFVAMLAGVFDDPLTAAGDPEWDPKEHPRGPDGKFIDKTSPAFFEKLAELNTAQAVAVLKGDDYQAQQLGQELEKLKKEGLPATKSAASKPFKPITAWTKTIHTAKYDDGQVVAVNKNGKSRLVWDGAKKKFVLQDKDSKGAWQANGVFTKKGAYDAFKNDKTNWSVPGKSEPKLTVADAIAQGDFSSLKKVGGQVGSTSGGFYEAPDGSRWYVKEQKSEKHAKNEALAAALYRLAGIDIPEVIRGKGTPGLEGDAHTATRIIEGAKKNLSEKMHDPAYLAKIREGFAVDAWLANWDAVGFSFDNIVEGADGKPHRIDAGGSLLFRAMGTEKGSAFGSTVEELVTLRNPDTAPIASKIFGDISAQELANSASKVEAISPDEIRALVKSFGLDPSLAETLIARRLDLLAKTAPAKTSASMPSPGQKFKEGDIWATTFPKSETGTGKDKITVSFPDNDEGDEVAGSIVHIDGKVKLLNLATDQVMYTGTSVADVLKQISAQYGIPIKNYHDSGKVTVIDANVSVPTTPSVPKISGAPGEAQWKLGKFTSTTAYKTAYKDGEVVGITVMHGTPARLVWEDGKFKVFRFVPKMGAWDTNSPYVEMTKATAVSVLKGEPLYKPPPGTMAHENKDTFTWNEIHSGAKTLQVGVTPPAAPLAPFDTPPVLPNAVTAVKLKPFNADAKPFVGYKTSYKAFNLNDEHIGAVHETFEGKWVAHAAVSHKSYMPVALKPYATQTAALKALEKAEKDYQSAQAAKPGKASSAGKKLPKLSIDKIESQNGVPPKSLTEKQKTNFLYRFMYTGPYGQVTPDMLNMTTLFAALVNAVNLHNKDQSPKLNLLQAINLADANHSKIYGKKVDQKSSLIAWLKTSGGKMVAPQILANTYTSSTSPGAPPPSSVVSTTSESTNAKLAQVPSAYDMGQPAKLKPGFYNKVDVSEASEMQKEMERDNPLTLKQQKAVEEYVGGSEPFNDPLRGNDPHFQDYQVELIQDLQEAMRPLPEAITVWRNTEGLGSAINAQTIKSLGDLEKFQDAILQDPSFLSTSLSAGVFNANGLFELVINLPEGTPAVFAHDYQGGHGFENEEEMLLAAGLQYRIDAFEHRDTYSGQKYRIYMTVVPKVVTK